MAASSVLAITIVPVLMTFFVREKTLDPVSQGGAKIDDLGTDDFRTAVTGCCGAGTAGIELPDWALVAAIAASIFLLICLVPQKIIPEERNPMSRFFVRIYMVFIYRILKWRKTYHVSGSRPYGGILFPGFQTGQRVYAAVK